MACTATRGVIFACKEVPARIFVLKNLEVEGLFSATRSVKKFFASGFHPLLSTLIKCHIAGIVCKVFIIRADVVMKSFDEFTQTY